MRRYETIVIVDPDLSENDRTTLLDRVKEIIPQQKGVLINEDLWGNKKLAYEIKNKPRGYYARFDYCGMGPVVDEVERFFRIDDGALKYLTVLLAEEADPEKILEEMAAEESAAETPSTPASPQPSEPETPAKEVQPTEAETAPAQPETTETATEASEKE